MNWHFNDRKDSEMTKRKLRQSANTLASIEGATPIYDLDDYGLNDWKVEFRIDFESGPARAARSFTLR